MSSDQIDALERLARLRDTGALSEAEFTSQKQALLEPSIRTGIRDRDSLNRSAPSPNRAARFVGESGFLAGLILSASCVGSAAIAAHNPSFANFRGSAIALCLFTATLAALLGWLSARRWLVPSVILGLWSLAQLYFAATPSAGLSTAGWLHRLAVLPTVIAIILAWDALRAAWTTKHARRAGQPAPAPIDRWGVILWFGRNPLVLVVGFVALVVGYILIDLLAQRTSDQPEAMAASSELSASTSAVTTPAAGPPSVPTSAPSATVDPGPLGWPPADSAASAANPEANLAAFRQQELHPAQNAERPTNWDEIVEQQEHQRALFYDVARRAPQLISTRDITWVRRDEAGIIQGNCDNRDTDMRVALYPALTDAFCDAHPSH